MPNQRLLTDNKLKNLNEFKKDFNIKDYDENYYKLISKSFKHLEEIINIRNRVNNLNISGKDAISFYTKNNSNFIEVIRDTARFSIDTEMTQQLTSYTNFLLSKERAGIERAVGSVTFARDKFLPGMKLKFNKLISEQDAFLYSFEKLTNKETFRFYKESVRGKYVEEVNRMRNIALTSITNDNFGIFN